jgi:hypothetical protein
MPTIQFPSANRAAMISSGLADQQTSPCNAGLVQSNTLIMRQRRHDKDDFRTRPVRTGRDRIE